MKTYILTAVVALTILAQSFLLAGAQDKKKDAMPDKAMDKKAMDKPDTKTTPIEPMEKNLWDMERDRRKVHFEGRVMEWARNNTILGLQQVELTDEDLTRLLEMTKDKGALGDAARHLLKKTLGELDRRGIPPATARAQDLIFLAESRPLLIRVHAHVNGKSVAAAWDEFVLHFFRYCDIDGDGFLSDTEVQRMPSLDEVRSGGPALFGGFSGRAGDHSFFTDMDTNKDGKINLAEFSVYLRKNGFAPFQLEEAQQMNADVMMYMGPSKTEPPIDAVADAIFGLLDTNRDGKISKEELAAAAEVLRRMDANEDEMLTTREIAPGARALSGMGGMTMMMRGNNYGKQLKDIGNSMILFVSPQGAAPADLALRMQERYSPRGKAKQNSTMFGELIDTGLKQVGLGKDEKPPTSKDVALSRADLGLDAATFAALDTNRDGRLDAAELAGFVKRVPDLEVVYRLGDLPAGQDRLQIMTVAEKGATSPLAGKIKSQSDTAMVELGATRTELRARETKKSDGLGGLMRQQAVGLFKQADRSGNGYLDEKEAGNFFGRSFKAMDRNGDGKVTEQEFYAYLDAMEDMKSRAGQVCVSLVLTDESRGLFDQLDVNRDGKLSIRELRGAVKLLESLDPTGTGHITRADIPRSYRLSARRGPAQGEDINNARFALLYGIGDSEEEAPATGPAWFRKMDRNRDGDVSRSEWLGSEEQFRQIDTDGDGLISVQEAERYDAQRRRK